MYQVNNSKTSLNSLIYSIWHNRLLIFKMTHREVVGRYKGSILGLVWSLLNPVIMLAIYTFVFSVVFKARWGVVRDESEVMFAMILFVGMIIHTFFSETIIRAPSLINNNVNFVKKVIFPLEILPVISVSLGLFHALVSIIVLLGLFVITHGYLHWTVIFFPIVFFPLVICALGLGLIFASLGVYLRDIEQTVGIMTTILMFLSPVFYPVSALPEKFKPWMMANPLTLVIEEARAVLIRGLAPDWRGLLIYIFLSTLFAWIGYFLFQKTRSGFSDVL